MKLGVFDSGLGGLTVVKEIQKLTPGVDIVYLGDTARVPYGIRSAETIKSYTQEGISFLQKLNVEAVVLACNSMSAYWQNSNSLKVPVFSVIEPAARQACKISKSKKVGILATLATIESQAYDLAIGKVDPSLLLFKQPAPLLVPLIEEGLLEGEIAEKVLRLYLEPLNKKSIDTLILGCTHYPLLLKLIVKLTEHTGICVVDSGVEMAKDIGHWLKTNSKTSTVNHGSLKMYVTDTPRRFEELAQRFLGRKPSSIEKISLGTSRG